MPPYRGLLSAFFIFILVGVVCLPSVVYPSNYSSDQYLNEPLSQRSISTPTATRDFSDTDAARLGSGSATESGPRVLWLIFKIVAVLALIVAGIFGVTKLLQQSGLAPTSNQFIKIHSSLPIGQNQFLRVVQIGKQFLVLGVTGESINRVCEITDPDTIQELKFAGEKQQSAGDKKSGFAGVLSRFVGTSRHSFKDGEQQPNTFDDLYEKLQNLNPSGGGET